MGWWSGETGWWNDLLSTDDLNLPTDGYRIRSKFAAETASEQEADLVTALDGAPEAVSDGRVLEDLVTEAGGEVLFALPCPDGAEISAFAVVRFAAEDDSDDDVIVFLSEDTDSGTLAPINPDLIPETYSRFTEGYLVALSALNERRILKALRGSVN